MRQVDHMVMHSRERLSKPVRRLDIRDFQGIKSPIKIMIIIMKRGRGKEKPPPAASPSPFL
jgi:hypothetical protein